MNEQIGSKDEGALFGVANTFAIRHQRRGQQADYDPVILDWIFWWYLATVELTDHLLAALSRHRDFRRFGTAGPSPLPKQVRAVWRG